jgi:NAD(P)-dependent dehydrogenase (short-subunit alcohol dehydrogenase family)
VSTGRFAGRRALITGASRGIGAATAERLAADGADVAITARTAEHHDHLAGSLAETAEHIGRHGTTVATVVADLSDEHDRARIVPEATAKLGGPIDILVNNAAAAMYAPVLDFPLKRRRILFEVNAFAPIDLAAAVAPAMVEAGVGWIVNQSSGAARPSDGPPFNLGPQGTTIATYGASKAALNRLTNAMAAELDGTGVRVNTIEPRAAVMSEGAAALVGDAIRADQVEPIESMVEAVIALCDCPVDITGGSFISLDLLDAWHIEPHALDGTPLPSY